MGELGTCKLPNYNKGNCLTFIYPGDAFFRIKRGGSRGFVLREDSMDEDLMLEAMTNEQNWLEKLRTRFPNNGKLNQLTSIYATKTENHFRRNVVSEPEKGLQRKHRNGSEIKMQPRHRIQFRIGGSV